MSEVPCSPHSSIDPPFLGLGFVLALAGIWRRVVQIKAIDEDDLIPL